MGVRRGKIFLLDVHCETQYVNRRWRKIGARDARRGVTCCCSASVTLVPKMEQGSAAFDVRNTFKILDSLPILHLVSIKNRVKPSKIHHVWNQFPFPSLWMSYVDGPEL